MTRPTNYAFLHGGGQGGWVWDESVAALKLQSGGAQQRCLVLDAPGCGTKRRRDTTNLTMDDVARELIADIEAADMTEVILVGHSQAGQALPAMAEFRPDLFRRLVHLSCSLPLPGQDVNQMMGAGRHGSNPAEVGWPFDPAETDFAQGFPLMFCNDMDETQAADFAAKLGQDAWPAKTYTMTDWRYGGVVAVPATYVFCLRDNILPMPWQAIFADRFKVDRRVHVDAGHQAMQTRPQALAEVLLAEK